MAARGSVWERGGGVPGLLVLLAGLTAAWVLSSLATDRFWEYAHASLPESFPWGEVTESSARTFEQVMGFLILALLICPVANAILLPAVRRRLRREG